MQETEEDVKKKIVFTPERIEQAVTSLANQLNSYYGDCPVTVVPLLEGSLVFAGQLMLKLEFPVYLSSMKVSRYEGENAGQLRFVSELPELHTKEVLVLDDIIDEGITLQKVTEQLSTLGEHSIRTCCLFDKKIEEREFQADLSGIYVERNAFIFGYGLDYNGRHRNLPYIRTK